MADTKISALTAATTVNAADQFAIVQSAASKMATASMVRGALANASTSFANGFAADTYLAGSAITIPTAGGWKVGTTYQCGWDMIKTAAGTAAMTVIVRMGTLGTTGDAAIVTFTYGAGTAAVDSGWFEVYVAFRAVGSGTSAVISANVVCTHHLAATGLISTGASGTGIIANGASAGFNSTTQTIIGLSVNGGASFAGTNQLVNSLLFGF